MNPSEIGRELGKLGKGIPKTLTKGERARRKREGITRLRKWHQDKGHKVAS